jgi:MYXO-CTERM domain-containing protein
VDFRAITLSGGIALGAPMGEFTPQVLVRIADEPIQFTMSPFATTADVMKLDPMSNGKDGQGFTMYSAKADITPGAKNAYVMIVNTADIDGGYTDLDFTMTKPSGAGGAGGAGGSGGQGGTGANPIGPVITDDGGCGCSIPGSSNGPIGFSLVSLAALAGLLGRRRRN